MPMRCIHLVLVLTKWHCREALQHARSKRWRGVLDETSFQLERNNCRAIVNADLAKHVALDVYGATQCVVATGAAAMALVAHPIDEDLVVVAASQRDELAFDPATHELVRNFQSSSF